VWAEILSSYDYVIEHLEGKRNPADGPARKPTYEIGYERPTARLLAPWVTTNVEHYNDLLQQIKIAQAIDALAADVKHRIVGTQIVDIPDLQRIDESEEELSNQWTVTTGVLTNEGQIYVPKDNLLRNEVMSLFHDNPESGHFGALGSAESVSGDFHWPAMDTTVRKYIAGCVLLQRIKAPRHAHHGTNMTVSALSRPWDGVTVDFVSDLPDSTASGYTRILVIVDRLTKMAIYIPCRKDTDSTELARMFFEHVICKRGVPDNIVTDRGNQITSRS